MHKNGVSGGLLSWLLPVFFKVNTGHGAECNICFMWKRDLSVSNLQSSPCTCHPVPCHRSTSPVVLSSLRSICAEAWWSQSHPEHPNAGGPDSRRQRHRTAGEVQTWGTATASPAEIDENILKPVKMLKMLTRLFNLGFLFNGILLGRAPLPWLSWQVVTSHLTSLDKLSEAVVERPENIDGALPKENLKWSANSFRLSLLEIDRRNPTNLGGQEEKGEEGRRSKEEARCRQPNRMHLRILIYASTSAVLEPAFGKIAAILWRYQMQEGEQEERFHGSVVCNSAVHIFIGDQCA